MNLVEQDAAIFIKDSSAAEELIPGALTLLGDDEKAGGAENKYYKNWLNQPLLMILRPKC